MRFHFLSLALTILFSLCLTDRSGAQTNDRFELKNRSTFAGSPNARNPFWPIGWKKTAAAGPSDSKVAVSSELKPENFVVSSILLGTIGTPSLAVINGKGYAEGETVAPPPGQGGTVLVAEIHDGTVVLQSGGQRLTVPLRRK